MRTETDRGGVDSREVTAIGATIAGDGAGAAAVDTASAEDVGIGGGAKGIPPGPKRNGVEKYDPTEYESMGNRDDEAASRWW